MGEAQTGSAGPGVFVIGRGMCCALCIGRKIARLPAMVSDPNVTYDVLILGGGFAGVSCAKVLGRYARKHPEFRVGLVAAENHMVFQPMLAEVAAGSISPRHVVNPIRQLCKGTDVFRGNVSAVDVTDKIVHVNAGDFTPDVHVRFRKLVVCLGAVIDLSRVPGMTEHSLPMQRVGDAMKLRATVIGRFEEANLVRDQELRRKLLTFVVVGGGYSGVETAGELLDLMHDMHSWYENVARDDFKVVLVHSKMHVLPTLSRRLAEYTQRELARRGVELVLGARVKAVTANRVTLDDGVSIETNTVISTIGNAPHPIVLQLAADLGVETPGGRLGAEQSGRVGPVEWLWTAGDCSGISMDSGRLCPATAQFAQRQGKLVGENILAEQAGKPVRPFTFTGLGELAAIGHRRAVADIFGMQFSGFFAWWMWRTIYLSKLPGVQRKLRVLFDWTFDLFFPRDINLLSPQYTRQLKEVYLAPGDTLFNPGDPAFSLYFVREGLIDVHDGDRLVKSVHAGEYLGERALLGDGIFTFHATAREPSMLIALGAPEFNALMQGSDALKRLFQRSAQSYLPQKDIVALKSQLNPKTLGLPAAELMNKEPDFLRQGASITDAFALLREKRHGSYPVLNDANQVVGSLKRDDLYDYMKSSQSRSAGVVGDLPLHELPEADLKTTGSELVEVMLRAGRNKVHVVDARGQLCGIVTVADLLETAHRLQPKLPGPADATDAADEPIL